MAFSGALLVATVAMCCSLVSADCSFRHTSMQQKHPLLIGNNNRHTDVRRFVRVDDAGNVNLKTGENITIACPGSYNYLTGGNVPTVQSLVVTCESGWRFTANGRNITLNSVQCFREPYHDLRIDNQPIICDPSALYIEVGYSVGAAFFKQYDVCFDQAAHTPLIARNYVVRGAVASRTDTMSAYLFTGVDPSIAYGSAAQTASFTEQLDATSAKKYITTANMLTYKQLVGRENFVFGNEQLSTYFYFNSVPVWKPFLNSYWSSLDGSIKKLTITDGDLDVYTAPHGVTQLPDSNGIEKSVYLHATRTDRLIPIPEYLLKSVRNDRYQEVIFVQVVNRGDVSRAMKAEGLCAEDVCAQLRWLSWAQVPAAQRPIACCAADDALLRSRLPLLQQKMALRGESPRRSAGLLVGSGNAALYAED